MNRRALLIGTAALVALPSLPAFAQDDVKALAREAYIYTYPMVKNYLTMYQYAMEPGGSQYKGPLNTIVNVARVYTPDDTAIITPNSDTPYSFIVFDLRAEPVVVTMPPIEKHRYYSLQLVDLYTHNVDYLGTRVDGNDGGDFLITGPGWKGEVPNSIKRVVEIPTALAMGLVRTQLLSPDDLDKVKEIQAGYKARPLSVYAGTASPPAPTPLEWPPISDEKVTTDFWPLAAFLLQFAPPLEGEDGLRDSFSRLGLKAGESWPPKDLPSETVTLMRDLVGPTEQEIRETSWTLTDSSKIFGTPEFMKGRYLDRAAAALGGIYGNSVEEALYVIYGADTEGAPLDGKTRKYALRFTPATLRRPKRSPE
jgi:hypothetical protein